MESILSLSRVHRFVYELQVLEEEKVREEVQDIERESQGEEKRSDDHGHVDGVKDSLLVQRCVCRRCDTVQHTRLCALRSCGC